jgi:hypothetical protein
MSNFTPDSFVLEHSKYSTSGNSPFTEKKVVYQNDLNNSSYSSNQLQFDLQSLASNGSYIDWSAGHLVVPMVLRLTRLNTIAGFDALDVPFAVGLKNDYSTIISSIQITIQNTTISQQTSYMPCLWVARKMLSWSSSYVEKVGASYGFVPDTTDSVGIAGAYTGVASPFGTGIINNYNLPQFASQLSPQTAYSVGQTNFGFYTRQKLTTAFNPNTSSISLFQTEANFTTAGLNYYKNVGDSKLWFIYGQIPLKDLHPFFAEVPLCKGLYTRLQMQTNQCFHNLRLTIAGGALTSTQITSSNVPTICPFMISNMSQTENGFKPITALCIAEGDGTYDFEVALSIGNDGFGNKATKTQVPSLSQCRIYVPTYRFKPEEESLYLSNNSFKKITYSDYSLYQYPITVSNGVGNFNQVISNGTSNLVRLWMLPYASNTFLSNGGNAQTEYASPFSCAPGTVAPWVQFANFNVMISGKTIFNQNVNYGWEQFLYETKGNLSLNAGEDSMLTSGLVSQADWSRSPWVCIDISRRLEGDKSAPKQVQVEFSALTTLSQLNILFFVEYGKEISLSVLTGEIADV